MVARSRLLYSLNDLLPRSALMVQPLQLPSAPLGGGEVKPELLEVPLPLKGDGSLLTGE